MEHISNKIDNLSDMMRRLSHGPPSNSGLTTSAGSQLQLHSSLQPSEPRVASCDNNAGARPRHQPLDKGEGIESTLFAHVIFAARFIQTVVANDPYSNVPAEMAAVLDNLQGTVNIQKQQNENLEGLPPFSKSLPLGLSFRDLPIPSMDRILACLRFAHGSYALASYTEHFLTDHLEERSPTRIYWPFEFGSLGDFTQYVIKACSPGPVTDAELIIAHYGLYYLFTECANSAGDDITKEEYEAQALICRDSLETILSNLSFYVSTNTDSVCAMYMAVSSSLISSRVWLVAALIRNAKPTQTEYLLPPMWQTLWGVDIHIQGFTHESGPWVA
jgi:hypothetical protein